MAEILVNDARVMSKGQVTIPKNIRNVLGVSTGDRVTFIVEGDSVSKMQAAFILAHKEILSIVIKIV